MFLRVPKVFLRVSKVIAKIQKLFMKESKSEIPTAAMVFKAQFMVTVSLIKKITFKPIISTLP